MNAIRHLRLQAGISQQTLAERGGTSQPTIAAYEAGTKSPTLATLRGLAACFGLELVVTYAPLMTREDRRSLAYHAAVAKKLVRDVSFPIKRAKRILARLRRQHPGAKPLFERWRIWLDLPVEELISKILDPCLTARDMRQVTPFAGQLSAKERTRILKNFQKNHKNETKGI